jgi:hypothetical protein
VDEQQGLYKHLSISVPALGKLPHPAAVSEIAALFGITDSIEDLVKKGLVSIHETENCIVVASPYQP